jgi:hypothetical protein
LWSWGEYLCEVRAGQYWRLENLRSFDEFLEKRFPDSRRKAYYLMAIHEHLPRISKPELKLMGWTKARELVKVARREGEGFDCAPWVHKAGAMSREEFQREVERHLTGRETEPHEILYFKGVQEPTACYRTGARNCRVDARVRQIKGYCLEMICADFLAGANLQDGSPDILLFSMSRLYNLLPSTQQQKLLQEITGSPCRD